MAETKARLISGAFTSTGDVRAENLDAGIDSANVVTLIDSAYVLARAPAGGLDSAASLALITGGNAITVSSGIVNHDDTSSQASVNNSGSFFLQDITLDDYGHVTAITSAEAASGGGGLDNYGVVNSTGTAAAALGVDAIAIGEGATATQLRSISIGNLAGQSSSGSFKGVNIGYYAGRHNAGNYNIAIGAEAMGNSINYSGISGADNIAIGQRAMTSNTGVSGYGNVAIGGGNSSGSVLGKITSGYNNVATGYKAGSNVTTGFDNVCVGKQAGEILTTGRQNVVIGSGALSGTNATNGQTYNSIYIGYGSICSGYRNTEIVLGVGLTGKGNSTAYMGANSNYNPGNNSSWNTTSDERIKTNVTDYTLGLDTLDQINVKTYNYLSDSDIATAHPALADSDGLVHEGLDTEKTIVGLMAQELEAVLPNSVTTRDNGIKAVNKDELFWVMLNSIKELKTANDSLVARVEALENA
jgi:hypothetical protein